MMIRRGAELVRELISYLIGAVVSEARRRLELHKPQSADDVRNHGEALIAFPPEAAQAEAGDQGVPEARMYRHPRVMRVMGDAEQIVFDLFARYQNDAAAICRPNGCRPIVTSRPKPCGRGGSAISSPG